MPPETVIPGVPLAPPVNVDATPAVATPPVIPGLNAEARLQLIKDRVHGAMKGETPNPKPIEAKLEGEKRVDQKPDDQKPETDLSVSPKVLRELGRLQAKVRELEPQVKDYATAKKEAELAGELKKLWSGTHEDKLKALSKLSGKEGLDTLADIVKTYYELEQNTDETDNANGATTSPETKKLLDLISEQNKKIEALLTDKAREKEEGAKSEATKNQEKANDYVKGFIDKNKSRFELCSRPENSAEAIDLAHDAAIKIVERDKLDIGDPNQAESAYLEALAEVEKEFENIGKRFGKTVVEKPAFDPDRYNRFVRRAAPTVVVKTEELSKNPDERFRQIAERARAKAEAGGYNR